MCAWPLSGRPARTRCALHKGEMRCMLGKALLRYICLAFRKSINMRCEWDFPSRSRYKLCVSRDAFECRNRTWCRFYTVVRIECVISIRNIGNEKEDKEFKRMRGARRGLLSFKWMIFVRCCCNTIIEHQQNIRIGEAWYDERDAIA